ncbi:hypothetical protein [Hydrogenibacillus sp. N12]|uniref:hypothetical protein n=1 Tax=Hydrogenibacillus sp. N12 TaxID=2866627 RepID=UPI001C7D8938|nr:hypothetical protein [Hydrogenibacillus sp. N12]QZA33927.1 hypothetical protein K2M58_05335 [Hydrogenibacillus sp. N12]
MADALWPTIVRPDHRPEAAVRGRRADAVSGADWSILILIFVLAILVAVLDTILAALHKDAYIPWVNALGLIVIIGLALERLSRLIEALRQFLLRF